MCFRRDVLVTAILFGLAGMLLCAGGSSASDSGRLYVGWAEADITPPAPVPLVGQGHKRISQSVDDPVTATVLALETRAPDGRSLDQAVMVSCDLCMIRQIVQEELQAAVAAELDDLDASKLFLNATHTHTAPLTEDDVFKGRYKVTEEEMADGVMTGTQYRAMFLERVSEAVAKAWKGREPGGVAWGLGQAVVGHNRRAVYFDGTSQMYGRTDKPDFKRIEGYEDHGLPLLFLFDSENELSGMMINVSCPSQETESMSTLSADFWHEVRQEIRQRHGKDIYVFAHCGAAGDISPHLLWRKQAERMMLSRKGISRRQEIALRMADAVEGVLPVAREHIDTIVPLKHEVARVSLPTRQPPSPPFYVTNSVDPIEFHVIRLGDVAIATNPFEIYLEYGLRIKARSKAVLTFLVQLSCRHCGYLPTAEGVRGGSYSAVNYVVGPEGGQKLVDETVQRINAMW